MEATLVDVMGDDLRVVNAARVSFAKESDWEYLPEDDFNNVHGLSEKDQKLIKYLAKHNHWTPFSHVQITMREKVPIFVARQRFKHMVGFTYNEVSRRYVDEHPLIYFPDNWRSAPENKKQGSGSNFITELTFDEPQIGQPIDEAYEDLVAFCLDTYQVMINNGVAPEQARMVLPQSMYTEYFVTGSLVAWARAYKLRSTPDAQMEIQELAKQWDTIIRGIPELKHSWEALIA